MFNKENFKYFLIWSISALFSLFFKFYGQLNQETLLINNYLVFVLVFGCIMCMITIGLVYKKYAGNDQQTEIMAQQDVTREISQIQMSKTNTKTAITQTKTKTAIPTKSKYKKTQTESIATRYKKTKI